MKVNDQHCLFYFSLIIGENGIVKEKLF